MNERLHNVQTTNSIAGAFVVQVKMTDLYLELVCLATILVVSYEIWQPFWLQVTIAGRRFFPIQEGIFSVNNNNK